MVTQNNGKNKIIIIKIMVIQNKIYKQNNKIIVKTKQNKNKNNVNNK